MNELKPCPKCGGNATMQDYEFDYRRIFYAKCDRCGKSGDHYNYPSEAAEAWNETEGDE